MTKELTPAAKMWLTCTIHDPVWPRMGRYRPETSACLKMTNAMRSRTVHFDLKRLRKIESTDPRVSGATDGYDAPVPPLGISPVGGLRPRCRA